jgi:predicted O-methyltransferase YrrM
VNCVRDVIPILQRLGSDTYVEYLMDFYHAGLSRFGEQWCYADITTVLLAVSRLIQPRKYLEIGVRRGRSMAMVAASSPQCEIVGFDLWIRDYYGVENPGAQFVRDELHRIGYAGNVEFVNGNSHRTVKEYLRSHPNDYFDLITVDGDHSKYGASLDLKDVLPRLSIGGIVVFDDISHPCHLYLRKVWKRYVADQPRFAAWEYTELGYGVAIGIRKY